MNIEAQFSSRIWLLAPAVLVLAALACALPGAGSQGSDDAFVAFQECANQLVGSPDFQATFGGGGASTDDLAVIAFNQCTGDFSLQELQAIADDPECDSSSRCSSFFNDYLGSSEPNPPPAEAEVAAEATETLAALPPATKETSQSEAPPPTEAPSVGAGPTRAPTMTADE